VDFINTTIYFEAHLISGVDENTRSMVLFNQSNRETVDAEEIPASTRFRLEKPYLVQNSLFFSDRDVFATERSTVAEVSSVGDFYVDRQTGIVTCTQVPPSGTWARYQYTSYPFRAKASPVILTDINLDSFKIKMFEQILQDDGTYEHGLPTILGAELINELVSVVPMYYGV
jgi:hypothetical protein